MHEIFDLFFFMNQPLRHNPDYFLEFVSNLRRYSYSKDVSGGLMPRRNLFRDQTPRKFVQRGLIPRGNLLMRDLIPHSLLHVSHFTLSLPLCPSLCVSILVPVLLVSVCVCLSDNVCACPCMDRDRTRRRIVTWMAQRRKGTGKMAVAGVGTGKHGQGHRFHGHRNGQRQGHEH
jgi:hypothetical protein